MRQETASNLDILLKDGDVISFQGEPGAFSHQACHQVFQGRGTLPCPTFEEAIAAVRDGKAALAMLPVENSLYGRVADIHHLLPDSGLHIVGEHFLPIRMQLLGLPGASLDGIKTAHSLNVALGQVRRFLNARGILPVAGPDTAGSARIVQERGDASAAAVASELAGEIYGLEILAANIEDADHNTTRFMVASPRALTPAPDAPCITSFVFRVKNISAALYKALGGFATNGVNMVRLESYMLDGSFTATQFIADIEGHPDQPGVADAMVELKHFTDYIHVLGVYPRHTFRGDA